MQPIGRIQRAFPSNCGAKYRENEDLLLLLELVAANLAKWCWRDGVSLGGLACFRFARGRALVTAQAPRRRFRGLACGERAGEHPASPSSIHRSPNLKTDHQNRKPTGEFGIEDGGGG